VIDRNKFIDRDFRIKYTVELPSGAGDQAA